MGYIEFHMYFHKWMMAPHVLYWKTLCKQINEGQAVIAGESNYSLSAWMLEGSLQSQVPASRTFLDWYYVNCWKDISPVTFWSTCETVPMRYWAVWMIRQQSMSNVTLNPIFNMSFLYPEYTGLLTRQTLDWHYGTAQGVILQDLHRKCTMSPSVKGCTV